MEKTVVEKPALSGMSFVGTVEKVSVASLNLPSPI